MPLVLQESLLAYRRQLAQLVRENRIEVCPARNLHRRYYLYSDGVFVCGMCQQLQATLR
jgi:hypothetical protein